MMGWAFRDLEPGDAGWVASRHGALYWSDEGYDIRFEALVLRLLADFIETRGPQERAWIAVRAQARLGCIFCTRPAPDIAKLRMFLVEPEARGTGLAQALLDHCMAHARETGADRLVLWTHESHRAAGRLYARNGFRLVDQKPVVAWGQPTVEQNWEIGLRGEVGASAESRT
ncbi:GNAT family N-acetyltransferase [Jannaschia aquimarina]|uniref:MshD_3 protein n=1 Tax=Jannaschia aquimarina TaxID=935700 RepID=A0A0D1D383_9RHOB|nr:GNAT family N-acetyltransferase [Jannaschia aquimarina]KIT14578.1 Mycothiol acetyltransferase [Jannaschia aquimarina]SNT34957.1 Acetyltransferase (GNAT) family protein [Jannaschia aquimarina]